MYAAMFGTDSHSVVLSAHQLLNAFAFAVLGPSIKCITLFWTNFDPLPTVTLCHTSRDPLKYVTHLGPPIFSSSCICLYRGFLSSRVFCLEFLFGVVFVYPPSVRIHTLQHKAKHHFQCMKIF